MPLINNIQAASIVNQSNIPLNVAKIASMPLGWVEAEDPGYEERLARDDTTATRYFRGPWSQRFAFYDWALGWSTTVNAGQAGQFGAGGQVVLQGGFLQGGLVIPAGGGIVNNQQSGFLTRNPPAQHPEMPWAYCRGVRLVKGLGAVRNNPSVVATDNFGQVLLDGAGLPIPIPMIGYYDAATGIDALSALVAVEYGHLDYEVRTDAEMQGIAGGKGELERWVVRESNQTAGYLPLPSGAVSYVKNDNGPPEVKNGNAISATAANIILFREELTYTHIDLPDPPYAASQACVGTVNIAPFDGARGWPTYDAGTLLYQGMQRKRHRSPVGRVCWDAVHRWLFAPTGWNNLPASDGNFWPVTYGGAANGAGPYPAADHMTLFQPAAPLQYQ